MTKENRSSYIKLIAAMLIFGTVGIFRRMIPYSSGSLAFIRGLLGAVFLIAFVKIRGGKIRHGIGLRSTVLLLITGALIGVNWICLFESYNYTTVPIATLCYYMQPTIVMLVSPLALGEKLTPRKFLLAILSVIGMVLVSSVLETGGISHSSLTGVLFGLAAAMLYASVIIMNKKVVISDDYEKTIIELLGAAAIMVPYLLWQGPMETGAVTPLVVFFVLILGIVHTGIAYALYFGGMNGVKGQTIALMSYIDPISALFLSALILGENLTILGFLGAVLIIGSAILSELQQE